MGGWGRCGVRWQGKWWWDWRRGTGGRRGKGGGEKGRNFHKSHGSTPVSTNTPINDRQPPHPSPMHPMGYYMKEVHRVLPEFNV